MTQTNYVRACGLALAAFLLVFISMSARGGLSAIAVSLASPIAVFFDLGNPELVKFSSVFWTTVLAASLLGFALLALRSRTPSGLRPVALAAFVVYLVMNALCLFAAV